MLRLPRRPWAALPTFIRRSTLLALFSILASFTVFGVARADIFYYSYTLRWTAPGDDSIYGRALAYDLRYSTSPITESSWKNALAFPGLAMPQPAGSKESFTLYGLDTRYNYYVAMKSVDESGNWSQLSDVFLIHSPQQVAGANDSTGLVLSRPWPNPATSQVRCAFALPRAGPVEIEALDIAGRLVRSLARGTHIAGRSEVRWDLTDDHGSHVAPGMYLIRARLLDQVTTRSVAVVR